MIVSIKGEINTTDNATLRADYASVMKFIKQDTANKLFSPTVKTYKGSKVESQNSSPAAMLADGIVIRFEVLSSDCTISADTIESMYSETYTGGATLNNICGDFDVDTNGGRNPNMRGKDYIAFWLVKNNDVYQILPHGTQTDGLSCVAGSTDWSTSQGCTYYYIYDKTMP
jgi:hypothetical protein